LQVTSQMTNRERVLAILNRESPDRIPWVPRLNLWYDAHKKANTLPARYRNLSMREIERSLGMGHPARDGQIFSKRLEKVEVIKRQEGREQITEWRTPVGSVYCRETVTSELDADAIHGRIIAFPLKGPADYAVWEYIAEHTYYTPAYDAYLAYDKSVGDDGYPLVNAGDVSRKEAERLVKMMISANKYLDNWLLKEFRKKIKTRVSKPIKRRRGK